MITEPPILNTLQRLLSEAGIRLQANAPRANQHGESGVFLQVPVTREDVGRGEHLQDLCGGIARHVERGTFWAPARRHLLELATVDGSSLSDLRTGTQVVSTIQTALQALKRKCDGRLVVEAIVVAERPSGGILGRRHWVVGLDLAGLYLPAV